MNEGLIASRYAKALLISLEGKEQLGAQMYAEAEALLPVLEENGQRLRELLDNVLLPEQAKVATLGKIFSKFAPSFMRYAEFLLRKGRGHYLLLSLRVFLDLYRAQRGIVKAKIRSASLLSEEQVEALKTYVESRFGQQVEMGQEVDAELIGGFQLVVGDELLDRSVRGELEQISSQLVD